MAKSRKKRKIRARKRKLGPSTKGSAKGHDFGAPFRTMFVPDASFIESLTQASTFACAYGYIEVPEIPYPIPIITLVAEREEPLIRAFREFKRWAEVPGGDALHMTIMIEDGGGYSMALSPDMDRMSALMRLDDPVFTPLQMVPMWIKYFDTRNQFVNDIRQYVHQRVAPFVFAGATSPLPSTRGAAPGTGDVTYLKEAQILKFKCSFIDKGDEKNGSQSDMLLKFDQSDLEEAKGKGKSFSPPPNADLKPAAIAKQRRQILEQNFPVTLRRIKASPNCNSLIRESSEVLEAWQIEQAICNLVLSREVSSGSPHYGEISNRKIVETINTALIERFEHADSSDDLAWVDREAVENQSRLDRLSLLRIVHKESGGTRDRSEFEKLEEAILQGMSINEYAD